MAKLTINAQRMQTDFETLAAIGATPEGGVHRPALSPAHLGAREWFRNQCQAAGLTFQVDGAGNHSGRLDCGPNDAPTLLLGSHLDSVPYGGRFDGALGVVAALEVVRTIQDAGLELPVNLEVIDFTDEEGTLVGLLGSSAIAGRLTQKDLLNPRGGRQALLEGFQRAGMTDSTVLDAARDPGGLAGYLELHIEQGERLEDAGTQIGIVTAIVGISSYRLAFLGRPEHAGTAGMETRLDASQGACAFTLAARQIVLEKFPGCVANVGEMEFSPGAFNIVPGRVDLGLEFRAPEATRLDRLESALLEAAKISADRYGLGLEIAFLGSHQPSPMSEQIQSAIKSACLELDLSHTSMPSFAGHDAQSLAHLCPVGMIFIPSVGGISHAPGEFSRWEDCLNGANVLLRAALLMVESV